MKAIILAAGKSSRLYPLTEKTPKCLLEITPNVSIIELQIVLLNALGILDILVVTGFESEKIKQRLKGKVRYCHYANYSSTNNLYTLESIKDELNDDIMLLFSDVILSKGLLKRCKDSLDKFNLIIDDREVTDKTMRVLLKGGSVVDIGSHISVDKGDGNFIGVAKFNKSGAKLLKKAIIHLCEDQKHLSDYYTVAFIKISKMGVDIKYTRNENDYYWREIDYLDDLREIRDNYNNLKSRIFKE